MVAWACRIRFWPTLVPVLLRRQLRTARTHSPLPPLPPTHTHTCSVPGARCLNTKAYQTKEAAAPKDAKSNAFKVNIGSCEWCERILLHEGSQTLFTAFKVRGLMVVHACHSFPHALFL